MNQLLVNKPMRVESEPGARPGAGSAVELIQGAKPSMPRKRPKIGHLNDSVLIYHSDEDGCWIAHSLRTDQVGTGERIVDALADLIKAVAQVCRLAERDPTVAYLREAPAAIRAKARRSKPLPREVYEVAYRVVHGDWPEEIEPDFRPRDENASFELDLREPVS